MRGRSWVKSPRKHLFRCTTLPSRDRVWRLPAIAGVAAARGAFIAFLDDDEEASPGWLAVMVACARKSGAAACFGPIEARAEEGAEIGPFAAYFSPAAGACLTVRILPTVPPISAPTTPCSRVRRWLRARGRSTRASTDPAVKTACSCSKSFRAEGGSPLWCAQGDVIEWVPQRRLDWAYVKRRKFLSGQIRTFVLGMLDPPRRGAMLFWMAAGAVQLTVYGVAAFILRPGDSERARAIIRTRLGRSLGQGVVDEAFPAPVSTVTGWYPDRGTWRNPVSRSTSGSQPMASRAACTGYDARRANSAISPGPGVAAGPGRSGSPAFFRAFAGSRNICLQTQTPRCDWARLRRARPCGRGLRNRYSRSNPADMSDSARVRCG